MLEPRMKVIGTEEFERCGVPCKLELVEHTLKDKETGLAEMHYDGSEKWYFVKVTSGDGFPEQQFSFGASIAKAKAVMRKILKNNAW